MTRSTRGALFLTALWAVVTFAAIASRPAWPIDETRYLSVAWEMWTGGHLLVPHLNGVPYSDKPPLLFWLILAGWRLFGVNEWWPRLVPSLFALANLFLTRRLARKLWPEREAVAEAAPLLLLASLFWSFYGTVLLFDMLLAFFALVAISGIVRAWQTGGAGGWFLVALAVGFGILAKGPAILLWVLPAVLLAPWWTRGSAGGAGWYVRAGAAVLGGAAIGLAWAVPAAFFGGQVYEDAILWGQTAGRIVKSFSHRRALWWYLPFLPVLVFPWLLWPRLWRAAHRGGVRLSDPGVRLCTVWAGLGFLAFSLVSGKQIHYLLPVFPPVALLAACVLASGDVPERRRDSLPIAVAFGVVGAFLLFAPRTMTSLDLPDWARHISPAGGICALLCGLAFALHPAGSSTRSLRWMAACSIAAISAMQWSVAKAAAPDYDVKRLGHYFKELEDQGHPIAHVGKYHGQFQFVGRLRRPIEIIDPDDVAPWFLRHPNGYVITESKQPISASPGDETIRQNFRGGSLTVRRSPGRNPKTA